MSSIHNVKFSHSHIRKNEKKHKINFKNILDLTQYIQNIISTYQHKVYYKFTVYILLPPKFHVYILHLQHISI